MATPKKVSFDFDGVLTMSKMQDYAKELILNGIEVWICTSRRIGVNFDNKDLFVVALNIGIEPERIIFTNNEMKKDYLNGKGFVFHIDDCNQELRHIASFSDFKPVNIRIVGLKKYCNSLLNINTI